jgi:hypothetical protein
MSLQELFEDVFIKKNFENVFTRIFEDVFMKKSLENVFMKKSFEMFLQKGIMQSIMKVLSRHYQGIFKSVFNKTVLMIS